MVEEEKEEKKALSRYDLNALPWWRKYAPSNQHNIRAMPDKYWMEEQMQVAAAAEPERRKQDKGEGGKLDPKSSLKISISSLGNLDVLRFPE